VAAAAAAAAADSAATAAATSEPATEGAAGSLTCAAAHGAAQQPVLAAAATPDGLASAQSSMQQLRLEDEAADSSTSAESCTPEWMVCPLTHAVLADPVLCTGDGQTYERTAIMEWLAASDTSPVTGQPLASRDLVPNHALRSIIQAAQARSSRG
jgi:U-box domain